jgi:hypothetical protein
MTTPLFSMEEPPYSPPQHRLRTHLVQRLSTSCKPYGFSTFVYHQPMSFLSDARGKQGNGADCGHMKS